MEDYDSEHIAKIMSIGMKALHKALGALDTELFLITLKHERFDYTTWRRDNLWVNMTSREILDISAENDPIGESSGLE